MKEDEKRRDGREEMILTVGREIPSEEQKDNKLFHTGCHAVLPSTHTLQKAEQVCGRPIKGQPASQPPSHPGLRETSGHTADSRCGCVRTERTAAVKGDAVTHTRVVLAGGVKGTRVTAASSAPHSHRTTPVTSACLSQHTESTSKCTRTF